MDDFPYGRDDPKAHTYTSVKISNGSQVNVLFYVKVEQQNNKEAISRPILIYKNIKDETK